MADGDIIYDSPKPPGHIPAIQRYSARTASTAPKAALFVGVQANSVDAIDDSGFRQWIYNVARPENGVESADFAGFTDAQGYPNHFAALYWTDVDGFKTWSRSDEVRSWWDRPDASNGAVGYWWEPVIVPNDRWETIAFREYVRGISACPKFTLEPINESGYWGAARDRIPLSPFDRMGPSIERLDGARKPPASEGARIFVKPPKNLAVIRSGVSWEKCGPQQLKDFQTALRPKLDAGMEYLRQHPVETGCCSLRQVTCLEWDGSELKEAYSLGHFLSFGHLERWARDHPTHHAIYARAMADRKKHGEKLELRTYHEVYVLDDNNPPFEYVNCHPATGILPYFE
jgi:aldoxime dehydratase